MMINSAELSHISFQPELHGSLPGAKRFSDMSQVSLYKTSKENLAVL
jgi:hypothetical protein